MRLRIRGHGAASSGLLMVHGGMKLPPTINTQLFTVSHHPPSGATLSHHPTHRLCGAHAASVTGNRLVGCVVRERDDGAPGVHVGAKPLDHGHERVGGCGHSGEIALQGTAAQIYGSRWRQPNGRQSSRGRSTYPDTEATQAWKHPPPHFPLALREVSRSGLTTSGPLARECTWRGKEGRG